MDRGWYWKFGMIVAVTLGTLWFLVPTYYSLVVLDRAERNNIAVLEQRLPAWAPPAKYRLNLGLDLQGGIHMV
ncbi:MAG: protein translocase subunit SecD, partial [Myxococcaceae bacterium]